MKQIELSNQYRVPQGDQIFNFLMKLNIAELKVIMLIQDKFVQNKKLDQSGKKIESIIGLS